MATDVTIINVALRLIGCKRITSLQSDTTKEAVVARDLYDPIRRKLLGKTNWNFAIKRVQLASSTTEPAFGFDYNYPLPDDYIRMVSVHPGDSDNTFVEYRLETDPSNDDKRNLVTNSNQIYIRYVWDLENVNLMSSLFRDALELELAVRFALAIPQKVTLAEGLKADARSALNTAIAQDGVEDFPERMPEGTWVRNRLGRARDFVVSNV